MNHTKKEKNKLEKLRGIFFQVGLIIAGGLTLVAFEWTSPIYITDLPKPDAGFEEPWDIIPIIPIEEKVEKPEVKKEVKKTNPDVIEILKNDTKEIEKKKEEKKKAPVFNPDDWKTTGTDPTPPEPPVLIAGVMPHFKECADMEEEERKACTQKMMFAHFNKSTRVPENIKMKGKAIYKAFVYFEINKKGEVVNVELLDDKKNKIPKELERQAYNAVKSLPEFNPGKNHGKKVSVKYTVPFRFIVN